MVRRGRRMVGSGFEGEEPNARCLSWKFLYQSTQSTSSSAGGFSQ